MIHRLILFLGAHYSYAEVDAFKFIREFFGWQETTTISSATSPKGLAILAREILLRNGVVNRRGWLNLFVISICLAFSAL